MKSLADIHYMVAVIETRRTLDLMIFVLSIRYKVEIIITALMCLTKRTDKSTSRSVDWWETYGTDVRQLCITR